MILQKTFEVVNMIILASAAVFTACENNETSYKKPERIDVQNKFSNAFCDLYTFDVRAKNWIRTSATDTYVKVSIPALTNKIMKEGSVMIYLHEAARDVALPFTYYQIKRAMSFQPSYEEGFVYINILGNFIVNNAIPFTFTVLVINKKGLLCAINVNLNDYPAVRKTLCISP